MAARASRQRPNILITGTPGTGKTTTSQLLAERCGFKLVSVGELVKQKALHSGHDAEFDTYVIDEDAEDRICDEMEPMLQDGGVIVDYHSCSFFPQRWFDLVVVLRTDNTLLGYLPRKLQENLECEIMQVVLDDAMESYDPDIVREVPSNTVEEMERSVDGIAKWAEEWQRQHAK